MVTSLAVVSVAAAGLLAPAAPAACTMALPLDGQWMLAPDPENAGREQEWWRGPVEGARETPVPWIIQEVFDGYHGVAWYWRDFTPPANPNEGGRYVLRFWAVDYLCDVYLNDRKVGAHEGAEDPFEFDVTDSIRPGEANRLAVRVLNPTYDPIDGITLPETPHRNKTHPYSPGADFNYGGITDSVELLVAPAVRVTDLFVRADPATGEARARIEVTNAGAAAEGRLALAIGPAAEGTTLACAALDGPFPPGLSVHEATLRIESPRLWDLSDPFLYRVTARVEVGASSDEMAVRTGYRDFRFERGAFRLNGKRIYLVGSHTGADTPVGVRVPYDLDLLRRDLLNVKAMNFNMLRFIAGVARRRQLDLADELGLLVYEECFAGWGLADSRWMPERFDHATVGMIRRDRNHPSVVIWGLLNETVPGPVLSHAVDALPLVREHDDSRVVLLNSGRWDTAPSLALTPGLVAMRPRRQQLPAVIANVGPGPVTLADSTWQPGQIALHPGIEGERAVVRWICPRDGAVRISAAFRGIAQKPTTSDVHVLLNDRELFSSFINGNGQGNEAGFEGEAVAKAGDTLLFVVGIGNELPHSDTTALELSIEADGETARLGSALDRAGADWSFGWMAADAAMGPEAFRAYEHFDKAFGGVPGGLANPGSAEWEETLAEQHPYQNVPHTAAIIGTLRALNGNGLPLFVSEYGIGSAVDYWRLTRHYEALGKTECEDARAYRAWLDAFLADYARWGMDEAFAGPADFLRQCLGKMGRLRAEGIDALRANPNIVAYSLTGTQDQALTGEGLTSTFRELKPGTVDALYEAFAPLRLCSFATPTHVYRGGTVRLETVLANVDVLKPGEYPLRVQLLDPEGRRLLDRRVTLTVPAPTEEADAPFAIPAFDAEIPVDGPAGRYRFVATLEQGGAATGGEAPLCVYDAAAMPEVEGTIARVGDDPDLDRWLAEHAIAAAPLAEAPEARTILVAGAPPADPAVWEALKARVEAGATAVFLTPATLARGDDPLGWLPLEPKGGLSTIWSWLYLKDEWAKRHPIFDGLQSGGLLDYTVYGDLLPGTVYIDQPAETEAIAGACKTSQGYAAGLHLLARPLGAGRVVLNTLLIRENLGPHPVAERLLRNLLRD